MAGGALLWRRGVEQNQPSRDFPAVLVAARTGHLLVSAGQTETRFIVIKMRLMPKAGAVASRAIAKFVGERSKLAQMDVLVATGATKRGVAVDYALQSRRYGRGAVALFA